MYQVGIDIGGTFTDAVLVDDDGGIWQAKVPTTPGDLRRCFFDGIDAVVAAARASQDGELGDLRRIVHGTTIATNIMVQHRGATTGLLTTKGFTDTIHIMQGHGYTAGVPDEIVTRIQELEKPPPIVPKPLIRGVPERVDSRGRVVIPLDEEAVRRAVRELLAEGVEAFAICFLWSFVNGAHEARAREIVEELAPDAFVCTSTEVAPRLGEYPRTVATAINAYVGPATSRYIDGLRARLAEEERPASLAILQCSGGVVSPDEAVRSPVRLIGSGPVGGTVASQALAASMGEPNVIACDMGGTSFDVSVVAEGQLVKQNLGVVDQYEYAVPSVEIQSIGAGGGSIVWLDEVLGTLRVGPQSAGAEPGPACYGRGGTLPTVTDCNLLVGYLSEEHVLASGLRLDRAKAERALAEHVAGRLGLSVIEAARSALDIVDLQMAELIRQLTIGRGLDPREFVVFAFGGAGPLHAPVFARELGVKHVVIPRGEIASLWSAFGAVSSDILVPLESFYAARSPFEPGPLEAAFAELEARGIAAVERMGVAGDAIRVRRLVDLRYGAQVHVLSVPAPARIDAAAIETILRDFDRLYEARNGPGTGFREAGVEMTAIRVEVVGRVGVELPEARAEAERREQDLSAFATRPVFWGDPDDPVETPILHETDVGEGLLVRGPAVVELETTTVPVRRGQTLRVDATGSFILELGKEV